MSKNEQTVGMLNENLLRPESKIAAKLATSGHVSKKVTRDGTNNVDYFWKHHWSFLWKRDLYEGGTASGQPLFSFKETCALALTGGPIVISNASQPKLSELRGRKILKINRRFVIDGVEYEWREKSGIMSFSVRFELVDFKSGIVLADYGYNYWSHKGVITIYEPGLKLAEPLVVGTALTMENLKCRMQSHGNAGSTV